MEPRCAVGHCLMAEDYGFFAAVKLRVRPWAGSGTHQVMWKMKSLALRFAAITLFSNSCSVSVTGPPSP